MVSPIYFVPLPYVYIIIAIIGIAIIHQPLGPWLQRTTSAGNGIQGAAFYNHLLSASSVDDRIGGDRFGICMMSTTGAVNMFGGVHFSTCLREVVSAVTHQCVLNRRHRVVNLIHGAIHIPPVNIP